MIKESMRAWFEIREIRRLQEIVASQKERIKELEDKLKEAV